MIPDIRSRSPYLRSVQEAGSDLVLIREIQPRSHMWSRILFFSSGGRDGHHIRNLSDSCLCQLLYRIYEDCHAAERRFLQIYCGRDQYNLYISGISDDWRRNKIYPPDRCHTAACQLWRKQCTDDDHHVQYHTGTLLHTITGRKTECSE